MFEDCLIVYRDKDGLGAICDEVLALNEYEPYREKLISEGYSPLPKEDDWCMYGKGHLEYFVHVEREMVVLAKCIVSESVLSQEATVKNS